jgi:hypothetical protein
MVPRVILMAILLAQLADAASFAVGHALHGIGLESNGFAVAVYGAAGVDGVLLVKGVMIVGILAILVITAPRYKRLLVWGGAAATSLGLLGFVANVASLLILAG